MRSKYKPGKWVVCVKDLVMEDDGNIDCKKGNYYKIKEQGEDSFCIIDDENCTHWFRYNDNCWLKLVDRTTQKFLDMVYR